MHRRTPSEAYADQTQEVEIGATKGLTHAQVLERNLGHERGMRLASGMTDNEPPVVVGDEPKARAQEAGAGNATPDRPVNEEINDKKLERHGNVGDAARRDEDGAPALGVETE